MTLTNEQYERVARRLDGEPVELTPSERSVADEVRRSEAGLAGLLDACPPPAAIDAAGQRALLAQVHADEAALAPLLDADVPREAVARAHRRAVAALARPQRRLMRIAAAAASVAAAAAVLLVVAVWNEAPGPGPGGGATIASPPARVPVEVIVASVAGPSDPAVDLVAGEIDALEADMLASARPAPVDMGLDQLEQALEDLCVEELLR